LLQTAVAIRHLEFEDLGAFEAPLEAAGYAVRYWDAGVHPLWRLDPVKTALIIVLGGPMGVYEEAEHPFLREELELLEARLAAGRPTLGVCLGAQLIARAAGAGVRPGPVKEIGFAPVTLTPEGAASCLAPLADGAEVLHWHGDTFDLPRGATRLASTAAHENQAFSMGRGVLGLQFHLEVGGPAIERWLSGPADELRAAGIDTEALRAAALAEGPGAARRAAAVLDDWLRELRP